MSNKARPSKTGQKQFSKLLAELLKQNELSRLQLADKLRLSKQYLNDIEKMRKLPSINFVKKLTCSGLVAKDTAQVLHTVAARAHGWEV